MQLCAGEPANQWTCLLEQVNREEQRDPDHIDEVPVKRDIAQCRRLGIVAGGIVFLRNGITHRFERDLRLPPNALAGVTTTLGRVGYIAKGIALILVGGLVVAGAVTYDPQKAGGLDGSLKALVGLPFGPVLLALIALGLIAYGVFWLVRSVAARL